MVNKIFRIRKRYLFLNASSDKHPFLCPPNTNIYSLENQGKRIISGIYYKFEVKKNRERPILAAKNK